MKDLRITTLAALAVAFTLGACGGDGNGGTACTPGATQACICPGGASGVQTCTSDGSGWSACDCGGADTSTDTGVPDTSPDTAPDTAPDVPPDTGGCTTSAECPADQVCMYNECRVPWGQEFAFLLTNGTLPERQWFDGNEYDVGGGMPDPFVEFTVDGSTCTTPTIDNTLSPVWNHTCNFTVYSSSTMEVSMWDEDMAEHDGIAYYEPTPIDIAFLRGGGVAFTVNMYDTGAEYIILNVEISPR